MATALARDVFMRTLDEIRAISSNPKILAATDRLELLSAAYMQNVGVFDDVCLTKTERIIAELLYRRMGKPVSREALMDALYYDRDDPPEEKLLDVFMCKVRGKLRETPYGIRCEWGIGYRMVDKRTWTEELPAGRGRKVASPPSPTRKWRGMNLYPYEIRLMELLSAQIGSTVSFDAIMKATGVTRRNTITANVSRMRKRLLANYAVRNVHGIGYRMELKPT